MSLGFEPGQPPSMYGIPYSSSIRAIAQLVGERQRDVLALRAVAERRVVEDDRAIVRRGHAGTPRLERRSIDGRSPIAGRADDDQPVVRVRRVGEVGRCASRRRAPSLDRGLDRLRPRPARPSDERSIIAADRIVPIGFARSWPAMSGAEPWIGSYRPNVPCVVCRSPSEADGSMPEAPGEHGRLVRQDVAEQVLGDDHVEVGRAA